jgi:putative SOS response-associated peptidase YedK
MCGRYVSVARVAELIEQYKATGPGDDQQLAPSYKVAPTNKVHAVLERDRPYGTGAKNGCTSGKSTIVESWSSPLSVEATTMSRPVRSPV